MSKPYRVIQWTTGGNGQALMRAVINHPDLELVGCKVFSGEKHGVDAGTLARVDPIGVTATTDRDEILALNADVVLHVPLLNPDRSAMDRDIIDLLQSGKNVIELTGSTSYPPGRRWVWRANRCAAQRHTSVGGWSARPSARRWCPMCS